MSESLKSLKIYRCPVCDTTVEVLGESPLELVCCGPAMEPVAETVACGGTSHALLVETVEGGVKVKVGRQGHSMNKAHRICWIELCAGGKRYREFLAPGQPPEAHFRVRSSPTKVRAYCTCHGLFIAGESTADDSPPARGIRAGIAKPAAIQHSAA